MIYSETESIILSKPLADFCIGDETGLIKLEYVIKKRIIIRSTIYAIKAGV
jgi:hypothetical protein